MLGEEEIIEDYELPDTEAKEEEVFLMPQVQDSRTREQLTEDIITNGSAMEALRSQDRKSKRFRSWWSMWSG